MPKEITHWLLAERVAKCITNTSPDAALSHAVLHDAHCRRMLFLGAILHDAPYYTLSSPFSTQRREAILLANRLHAASEAENNGQHDDSFDILRAGISALAVCAPHEILAFQAFLLGMCTHICADCRFHPRIYYASGNLWQSPDEAWSRHRALESALDLAFCLAQSIEPDSYSLSDILCAEHQQLSAFLRLLPPLAPYGEHILRGFSVLAAVRRIGTNRRVQAFLDQTEPLFPANLRAYTALRYTKHSFLHTFLHEEADIFTSKMYRHPVTGEAHQHSYQELFDAAKEDSLLLWEQITHAHRTNTTLADCGASLEHGLVQQSPRAMLFFANP